jgi:hypothetical protein
LLSAIQSEGWMALKQYRKKILSEPKQKSSKKIAWILAGLAIGWYLISMFTMWK